MRRKKDRDSGVSLVEFSLVAVVVITFSLGIIDLGRFFATRYLAYQGVLVALDKACKAPYLNLDPSALTGTTRTSYIAVMNDVLSNVNRIGGAMVRPGTATKGSRFVPFSVSINGSPATNMDAVLLRPGDCFTASDGYKARNPTAPCGTTLPSSYEDALRMHPLVVESRVRFMPLTPLIGSFTMQVRAAGFRELFERGSGAAAVDVPVLDVTPIPTPTPGGGGGSGGGGSSSSPGSVAPTPAPPPACSKSCGANMILVSSSCTCYCGIGYCPRGTANPGSCSPGCGG